MITRHIVVLLATVDARSLGNGLFAHQWLLSPTPELGLTENARIPMEAN